MKKHTLYWLYIHINKLNNKVYIGWATNPKRRWGKNGSGYKAQSHFYNAIKKYGWDGFYHILICFSSSEEHIKQLECDYIQLYNADNPDHGYNKTKGGDGYNLGKNAGTEEYLREYNRKYHLEHKEEHNSRSKSYYQEHKEELSEYYKKYEQEHKEERVAKHRKYYQEHKEERATKNRKYYLEHREEILKKQRERCITKNTNDM